MLKVVVSQREDLVEERNEVRDVLDRRLVDWLLQVGVHAVPVPNTLQGQGMLLAWLASIAPQAVLLSGGNDIGSSLERDATETALLNYAAENDLPLLGICRGMQMMACYAGGTLQPVKGHAATRHLLRVTACYQDLPTEVNSYHNWALDSCPFGYEILALAPDDTVEAIRHGNKSWEGWMWHPERESPFKLSDIDRARKLFFKLGTSK